MADATMAPEWRVYKPYPDYEVSSDGQVRKGNRYPKPQDCHGYVQVAITAKPKQVKLYVHRMVAETFLPPPIGGSREVDHINGDRADNRASNLRWATRQENIRYRADPRSDSDKIAPGLIASIRRRRAAGHPTSQIAKEHGVNEVTVWRLSSLLPWEHLPPA